MAEERKPSITRGFGTIFRRIRKRERFASPPLEELSDRMFDAIVAAAIAKCVEFNVAANRSRRYKDEEFVFVGNLRGICEDLINLCYISRLCPDDRRELSLLLISRTVARGLEVQKAFFNSNNPFQPVLGTAQTADGDNSSPSRAAREALRTFWASLGSKKRDGSTVKDMAEEVGLKFTYDYIYFASSNFVHFNPQALLRTGWGDMKNPFKFSVSNVSVYYQAISTFYGAILFIGFHSAFALSHFDTACENEITSLLELIDEFHRWPEVVTFEEMNQKPPLFLLTHAMRKAFPEKGAPDGILAEVRSLGSGIRRE